MKNNVAVVYKSKYGATKQYAAWIAEELGAELLECQKATPSKLQTFDLVIYGGGLYAGGIIGANLVAKIPIQNLIVFSVGLADPDITDYSDILIRSFSDSSHKPLRVFHFRGRIDYKKLSIAHRGLMAVMKKMTIDKKTYENLTTEEKAFADTYGNKVDFTERSTITPLVDYVKDLIDTNHLQNTSTTITNGA